MLETATATRFVIPLREGGSLPGVLEADDLGIPGPCRLAHLRGGQDRVCLVTGLDDIVADPAGAEQAAAGLGAQLGPTRQVVLGGGERREVEDGRAVATDGEAELGVEEGGPGRGRGVGLGDEVFERGPVEGFLRHAVAVVVDEVDTVEPAGLSVSRHGHTTRTARSRSAC